MSLLEKLLNSKGPRASRRGGTLARIAAGRAVRRDRRRRVIVRVPPRARRAARAEDATIVDLRLKIERLEVALAQAEEENRQMAMQLVMSELQLAKVSEQRDHLVKAGY